MTVIRINQMKEKIALGKYFDQQSHGEIKGMVINQAMPTFETHQEGFKIWCRSDSQNGYIDNFMENLIVALVAMNVETLIYV